MIEKLDKSRSTSTVHITVNQTLNPAVAIKKPDDNERSGASEESAAKRKKKKKKGKGKVRTSLIFVLVQRTYTINIRRPRFIRATMSKTNTLPNFVNATPAS